MTLSVLPVIGCGEHGATPPEPAHPKNVIFVLVDTLRADHTSIHGYSRPTTPFLEQLAAESVVFDRARSQAGCTYPSMNSMLTSRYPFDFYRREPGDMGIPEEYPSIAEILKAHGYFTAAVSASPIVRATPSEHNPSAGFGRGFDVFDESVSLEAGRVRQQARRGDPRRPRGTVLPLSPLHGPARLLPTAGDPPAICRPLRRLRLHRGRQPEPDQRNALRRRTQHRLRRCTTSSISWICTTTRSCTSTPCSASSSSFCAGPAPRRFDLHPDRPTMARSSSSTATSNTAAGVWNTLTHVPMLIRAPGSTRGSGSTPRPGSSTCCRRFFDYLELSS